MFQDELKDSLLAHLIPMMYHLSYRDFVEASRMLQQNEQAIEAMKDKGKRKAYSLPPYNNMSSKHGGGRGYQGRGNFNRGRRDWSPTSGVSAESATNCGRTMMFTRCNCIHSESCHGDGHCYNCGCLCHYFRLCPNRNAEGIVGPSLVGSVPIVSGARTSATKHGSKEAKPRIYALTQQEAVGLAYVIIGMIPFCGQNLIVLFDSGASHSYISKHVVDTLEGERGD